MREKTCLVLLGSDPEAVLELGERLGAAGLTLPKSRRRRVRPAQASTLGSERLAEINSLFTAALERRQDDWRSFDASDLSISVISKFESEIRAAITEDYENAQSIVLAFPCRSYYFTAYLGALNRLGYKTSFAFVFSSPSQVTTSSKRDHSPVEEHRTLNLVQAQLEGEYLTRGEARIFLETGLGPHELSEHIQKIASAFPDAIPQITARDKGAEENRALVDITSFDTVSGDTLAFDVYSMLQRLEIDPTDEVALRRLDEIRHQIDKAAETVGRAYFGMLEYHAGAQAKKVPVALDGSEHSLAELNDSFRAAVTFLRKPYRNALSHRLSCVFAGLPFFSATRRARFQRSARKRDYKEIAARLRDVQFELARDPAKQEAVQFINSLVPKRRKVVSSDWHVAVLKALANPDVGRLPSLTISLVTFNSGRWLDGFFDSLIRQNYPLAKLNVIFVDHGSTDDTLARINEFMAENAQKFASIRSVERDNKGFGAGHDFAIRQSTDTFVLVSNVDLKFHPDTLSRLVAAAQEDEPDVASWEARQCPYEHPKYYDPVTLETSWSSHACILMRRAAYLDVGGYEDRIFMYGEDVELSYRFRGAGYRLRYLPQVSVTHFVSFDEPELRPHQLGGRYQPISCCATDMAARNRDGAEKRFSGKTSWRNRTKNAATPSAWHLSRSSGTGSTLRQRGLRTATPIFRSTASTTTSRVSATPYSWKATNRSLMHRWYRS